MTYGTLFVRAAAIGAFALIAPKWARAQLPQGAKPPTVMAPSAFKVVAVVNPNGDVTAETVTLALANGLSATMSTRGQVSAELRNVVVWGRANVGVATSTSVIWLASSSLAAGRYHIRYSFTLPGQSSPNDKLAIHKGQNASDPVLTTCIVTSFTCDVIVDWPGGGRFDLAATLDGNAALEFSQVTMAPTVYQPRP
jgi:hypothetical protein